MNWLTEKLKEEIDLRNKMKKHLDKYGGSNAEWRKWKRFRNKVNKDLKNAKRDFLKAGLQHSLENAKTLWNGVKNHLGWKSGVCWQGSASGRRTCPATGWMTCCCCCGTI